MPRRTREETADVKGPKDALDFPIQPVVGDFCTQNEDFAQDLRNIVTKIQAYVRHHGRGGAPRPYNVLLSAPPGMGKSFLAKQLAKEAVKNTDFDGKVTFDEVFVASMASLNDINDVFRRAQSEYLGGAIPAVLFDEFDSQIEKVNVYNRFLSPMWDGKFYVGAQKFSLPPCIFFFAGSTIFKEGMPTTALQKAGESATYFDFKTQWEISFKKIIDKSTSEKIKDFVERLDDTITIPPIKGLLTKEKADLEYRVMACILIQKHHGGRSGKKSREVVVDMSVIEAIAAAIQNGSLRKAEKAIFSASVDPSRFAFGDLPEDFKRDCVKPTGRDKLVRIFTQQ